MDEKETVQLPQGGGKEMILGQSFSRSPFFVLSCQLEQEVIWEYRGENIKG